MKTYNQAKSDLDYNKAIVAIYDKLHTNGIAYKDVHYYEFPKDISSNYSMGEKIVVKCGGNTIHTIDQCMEYSKSCKWRARHGYIVLAFTKKGLKDYVAICKKIKNETNLTEKVKLYDERRRLLNKYISIEKSTFNRKISVN